MESLTRIRKEYDVAIVGGGPVGLTLAIELSRHGLSALVLERRPPLDEDTDARPQLLVARAGDLAHLTHLGVDTDDPHVVSLLATRCERDLLSGRTERGHVRVPRTHVRPDLRTLASQPPLALVPIARLQQALLARALELGATVIYDCEVTRMRRHARHVSLQSAGGASARAAMAILATGAARSLVIGRAGLDVISVADRRLIAGVFAVGGELGQWARIELPVAGFTRPARCTLLQTPTEAEAGTALLVDVQVPGTPTGEQLARCFAAAARVHGLDGAPLLVQPRVFATAVTALSRRTLGGDGRAPVLIAGDAAQTGHVFTGQTCFVNLALALGLSERLRAARDAIVERKLGAPALADTLARYETQSALGASILARASERHYRVHPSGAWALAGVAHA